MPISPDFKGVEKPIKAEFHRIRHGAPLNAPPRAADNGRCELGGDRRRQPDEKSTMAVMITQAVTGELWRPMHLHGTKSRSM